LRHACVDVAGCAIRQRKDFEHGSLDSFYLISMVVIALACRWATVALGVREGGVQEIAGDKDGTSQRADRLADYKERERSIISVVTTTVW